jgi:filamentous hemagglutinin family protein
MLQTSGQERKKWSIAIARSTAPRAIALFCLGIFITFLEKPALGQSQIVPDNTLGNERSKVREVEPQIDAIAGGARRGINLFHSFREFNVGERRGVYFTNPTGVENILSRVTGTNPSNILGKLGVLGNANLFLINPNGIIFGQNASLDVKGSFVATSASAIQFGRQGNFSAASPQIPLLTIDPSALLFNQISPGTIVNQSIAEEVDRAGNSVFGLRVPDGQNLLLVGGDIILDRGVLNALGGRVELSGVGKEGRVEINDDFSLKFPPQVPRANVSLNNGAFIRVATKGGGAIAINAKKINLSGSVLLAGIAEGLGRPNAQAGDITLNATDAIAIEQGGGIGNFVSENATGDAGDIKLEARSVLLKDGARISSSTRGVGNGGLVLIQATEQVKLSGSDTAIFSDVNSNAIGNAGGISIDAGSLLINDGAFINSKTGGWGNAGDINIKAQNSVAIAGTGREDISNDFPPAYLNNASVLTTARGNSGDIHIEAGSVSITNFASFDSSSLDPANSNAGNVFIKARDSIFISESGINTLGYGIGNAGNVVLEANAIATERDSFIDSSNLGQGNSGNISFQARSIAMKDPFIRSRILGTGQAGDLTFIAEDTILLAGERTAIPTLATSTEGPSSGGNMDLQAKSISILNGIVLDARSLREGDGGTIDLDADTIKLDNSLINASANGGTGKGGQVRLNATESIEISGRGLNSLLENLLLPVLQNPNFVETLTPDIINDGLLQGIIAPTFGPGDAGSIEITTDRLTLREGALITTATIGRGSAGKVAIDASEFLNVDGAVISTSTITDAKAGNIEIDTSRFLIDNGGQVITTTLGSAEGGDLIVKASEEIEASGRSENGIFNSSLSTGSARSQTVGNGGDLTIFTPQLTIRDGANISASTTGLGSGGDIHIDANSVNLSKDAEIAVSSQGRGNAGELTIRTDLLSLEARSRLSAETVSGQGGNINLQARDFVLLRDNSNISTTAGSEGARANGGNIEIDTNFLFTVPSENSDITANAFEGRGGFIEITAQGIFGLDSRDRLTPLSDITAFSRQNPQLNGVIEINSPDVDVSSEVVALPETLVDVSRLIAQRCSGGRGNIAKGGSEFIITGRGGLPPQPSEALRTPAISVEGEAREETSAFKPLVEATGWTSDEQGRIVLVATTANELKSTSPSCHAL